MTYPRPQEIKDQQLELLRPDGSVYQVIRPQNLAVGIEIAQKHNKVIKQSPLNTNGYNTIDKIRLEDGREYNF